MTKKQELFDMMWRGLEAQGWERAMAEGLCAYATEAGLRCAVGHCLSEPVPGFVGDIYSLVEEYPEVAVELETDDPGVLAFLYRAQRAHDDGASPKEMLASFKALAFLNGLVIPEVQS